MSKLASLPMAADIAMTEGTGKRMLVALSCLRHISKLVASFLLQRLSKQLISGTYVHLQESICQKPALSLLRPKFLEYLQLEYFLVGKNYWLLYGSMLRGGSTSSSAAAPNYHTLSAARMSHGIFEASYRLRSRVYTT